MQDGSPGGHLPPVERGEMPATGPRWPKLIGVISLIYAICGLIFITCLGTVFAFATEQLMKMGGMDVQVPLGIKVMAVIGGLINAMLGCIMVIGAVALLRRRRSGVAWLNRWAIIRLLVVFLNVLATYATAPMQMDLQRSIIEAQNDMFREQGMTARIQEVDDDKLWRKVMIPAGVMSAMFCVYPAFLAFYLSTRRVRDDIREWA